MTAYYNEFDPFAAEWLRNLIAENLIAPGDVDERSIEDVKPNDLLGYTQCHFFAGIGGWSYALRLAGWPDSTPVWTGSCPCQPFSSAGKSTGFADERHLWPAWFHIISQLKPSVIFGEQVDKALDWLDLVQADLEAEDYSCGAIIAPAASVGAPHVRHRLWFVADSESERRRSWRPGGFIGLYSRVRDTESTLADTDSQPTIRSTVSREECHPWSIEPSVGRVVNGISHKLVAPYLKGYGNAIVPQVAAEVIKAYMGTK